MSTADRVIKARRRRSRGLAAALALAKPPTQDREDLRFMQHKMPARPGAHTAYQRGADLVVEWYDFGDDAPYESANLLVLGPESQAKLAAAMELSPGPSPDYLAACLAGRFESWFAVKEFLAAHRIAAQRETDFMP